MGPTDNPDSTSIAYFVTDHGYGHATRAAAVMAALAGQRPGVCFEVFTTAPAWLFGSHRSFRFRYHRMKTDVGLIQSSPFDIDLNATAAELGRFLPFDHRRIRKTAAYLKRIQCRIVVCDIAPVGIRIAAEAGIPAVLVENFTWDWIYAGYGDRCRELQAFSRYLHDVYSAAGLRIQVKPFCESVRSGLETNPVSRSISSDRASIRAGLGISASERMILVSMGGLALPQSYPAILPDREDVVFVIPGGSDSRRRKNLILLPHLSKFAHPDLVNAADAVIAKVGYSTLAEVFQVGVPYGYLPRDDFPESAVLVDFIERHIPSLAVDPVTFAAGDWQAELSALLALRRVERNQENGAAQVARHIVDHL